MGFPLQMGDAFWRARPEPPRPLRSLRGLELALILPESPPSSAPILLLWWMYVDDSLEIVGELVLPMNIVQVLVQFKFN
ncbi:hypothetical protein CSV60_12555 [Sporosarcina sp. P7]|nr:hypothetical protein CSV60_12555 [Sporosarcina sp. P7]